MKNIRQYIHIFFLLSKYSVATAIQNKIAAVFFTIGKLIRFGMFFFFIYYLVAHTKTIKGYTTDQAIMFFLTFNIVDSVSQTLYREVYRFRQLVVTGELNAILVKPYPTLLRVLMGGVDPMDLVISIGYVFIAAYFIHITPHTSSFAVLNYWLLIINALIITTAFHIGVLGFGIITSDVDHSILIYRDVTSAGRFPLEIYREPLRSILTFVLPVGIMMSFPAQALFGRLGFFEGFIGVVITFGALGLALIFWNAALYRYQSWGG